MAPFAQAPAVVGALLDQVNLFPQVLPILADPELARLAVVAEPPRVPEAVSPHLGPGALAIDERVVFRYSVVSAWVRMIDVDPQYGPQQVVDGLAGQIGVRAAGAVPRRDVEIAVVAKSKVAAVVAVGGPLNDRDL